MRRALLLLLIAVIIAGCTTPGSDGTTREEQDEPKVIQVSGPECVVSGSACRGQELTKYDGPARISAEFSNYGENPTTVRLGQNGSEVMVGSCNPDLVGLRSFEATVTGPSGRRVVTSPTAEIDQGEVLRMVWTMDIVPDPDANVSSLGYTCPLSFDLGFSQNITTSRQVQIKGSESVPDVQGLARQTTSKSPVELRINAPDHFVADGGRTLVAEGYLVNVGPGSVTSINSLTAREFTCRNADEEIRMFGQGPRAAESYRRVCTNRFTTSSGSDVADIVYETNYDYSMPLGGVTLSITSVG